MSAGYIEIATQFSKSRLKSSEAPLLL